MNNQIPSLNGSTRVGDPLVVMQLQGNTTVGPVTSHFIDGTKCPDGNLKQAYRK